MDRRSGWLDGQFLIAMPGVEESNFSRSVIYLCAHSGDGAMGLIINKPMQQLTFRDLLVQLEIIGEGPEIQLPATTAGMRVHRGGPVETGRGFVLHSSDYHLENSTLPIGDSVSLTATLEILKAIAEGRGPELAMLALGYAGWGPGQLESEIQANGWLTSPADPSIIFESDLEDRYTLALATLGIDPALLSSESGHA
jgi:putative transcriptional regulator